VRGPTGAEVKVAWRRLSTILTMDEMLDKAYGRAKKASDRVDDPVKVFRVRKQLTRMVQTAADVLSEGLEDKVREWPSLNHLPIFDQAMVDASVGCDLYRHHLSMLTWGSKQIRKIANQNVKKITRSSRFEVMHQARKEAYGRISSIMRRVSSSLDWLNDSRLVLRKLPEIDEANPTIVVCGAPNVGKSAFISSLSSGNMEVNHYPFTTKQLHVGHFEHRRIPYQMVDTPGLLDRTMDERNEIEMQAIAAISHIGSVCLFVIDATEDCGLSIEQQMNLREEVKELLGDVSMLTIISKADLLEPKPANWNAVEQEESEWDGEGEPELSMLEGMDGFPSMSTLEQVGVTSVRLELIRQCLAVRIDDPMQLPTGWHRRDLQ
jgi:nucleolar GTP-binding protein